MKILIKNCLCIHVCIIFVMFFCYFRGYQLHNPFHTIWATKLGSKLAVSLHIHSVIRDEPFLLRGGGGGGRCRGRVRGRGVGVCLRRETFFSP